MINKYVELSLHDADQDRKEKSKYKLVVDPGKNLDLFWNPSQNFL